MKQLACLGRLVSLFVVVCLYAAGWTLAYLCLKGYNDDLRVFTKIWISIHIGIFFYWILWSWLLV